MRQFLFSMPAKKGIPKMDILYKTNTGSYDLPSSTLISTSLPHVQMKDL